MRQGTSKCSFGRAFCLQGEPVVLSLSLGALVLPAFVDGGCRTPVWCMLERRPREPGSEGTV